MPRITKPSHPLAERRKLISKLADLEESLLNQGKLTKHGCWFDFASDQMHYWHTEEEIEKRIKELSKLV